MKAANSICRRCHRLRPVNVARYCTPCAEDLRAGERRRPVVDESTATLAPSLAPAAPAAAPSLPPTPFRILPGATLFGPR